MNERNVVLIGCAEDLHRLTLKERGALESVFADALQRPESDLREMLIDSGARGSIVAQANHVLGRSVLSDWYVDFWNMAY